MITYKDFMARYGNDFADVQSHCDYFNGQMELVWEDGVWTALTPESIYRRAKEIDPKVTEGWCKKMFKTMQGSWMPRFIENGLDDELVRYNDGILDLRTLEFHTENLREFGVWRRVHTNYMEVKRHEQI